MPTLRFDQRLPISIQAAWDFFSTPKNLNAITPKNLNFNIVSELPNTIYEGLLIQYKVAPVLNLELTWLTEITHLHEPHYFVDEQRKGPYKIWHHEHHFKKENGHVLMTDILYYEVGMYFIGSLAEKFFVNKKVKEIFEFRHKKLQTIFAGKL